MFSCEFGRTSLLCRNRNSGLRRILGVGISSQLSWAAAWPDDSQHLVKNPSSWYPNSTELSYDSVEFISCSPAEGCQKSSGRKRRSCSVESTSDSPAEGCQKSSEKNCTICSPERRIRSTEFGMNSTELRSDSPAHAPQNPSVSNQRMSQQGNKRSRLGNPEDVQAPVKRSRHEVQSSEKVQQDQTKLEIPAVAEGLKGDKREEVELESSPEDQSQEQVSNLRKYDDDGLLIIRPPPPITNWRFGVKEPSPPPVLTEEEREIEELWEEMDFLLNSNEDSNSEVSTEESSGESTHDGGGSARTSGASSSGSG